MTIQHSAVSFDPQLVRGAVNVNPVRAIRLVLTDLVADFRMKDLRAAAWHTSQARILQVLQNIFSRHLGQKLEPVYLDRRPAL